MVWSLFGKAAAAAGACPVCKGFGRKFNLRYHPGDEACRIGYWRVMQWTQAYEFKVPGCADCERYSVVFCSGPTGGGDPCHHIVDAIAALKPPERYAADDHDVGGAGFDVAVCEGCWYDLPDQEKRRYVTEHLDHYWRDPAAAGRRKQFEDDLPAVLAYWDRRRRVTVHKTDPRHGAYSYQTYKEFKT